jgi:hypothetical protein
VKADAVDARITQLELSIVKAANSCQNLLPDSVPRISAGQEGDVTW